MKQSVIIVAGGEGLRMGSDLPKQSLPIGGEPVLTRTLEVFRKYDVMLQIILVLPREQQDFWKRPYEEHHFSVEHPVADGGETRLHSVKSGLALMEALGLVGVHDGVRPSVPFEVIRRCYKLVEQHKAVIPVADVVETLRHLTDAGSEAVSRTEYKLVQTPQVFDVELLKQAYGQEFTPFFTDGASVVEAMGVPVHLTEGNRENIKITTPFDLKAGSAFLQMFDLTIRDVKFIFGAGSQKAAVLNKELEIYSLYDLVYYFPYKYIDRSHIHYIHEIDGNMSYIQLKGEILGFETISEGRQQRLTTHFSDGTGTVDLVWFQGIKYILGKYEPYEEYIILGKPTVLNGRINVAHPDIDKPDDLKLSSVGL